MASSDRPRPAPTGSLTLVLGGARSGKSALAERLVLDRSLGDRVHYVATAVLDDGDGDLAARVAAHRARRGEQFRTVEAGDDLAGAVRSLPDEPAIVDALGTWLASPAVTPSWADPSAETAAGGQVAAGGLAALGELLDDLVAALTARGAPTVVVSDEAGLGVHPEHPLGRHWRDALGIANQRVAAAAGDVWLVIAGRVLPLSRPEDLGLHDAMDRPSRDATHGEPGVGTP